MERIRIWARVVIVRVTVLVVSVVVGVVVVVVEGIRWASRAGWYSTRCGGRRGSRGGGINEL